MSRHREADARYVDARKGSYLPAPRPASNRPAADPKWATVINVVGRCGRAREVYYGSEAKKLKRAHRFRFPLRADITLASSDFQRRQRQTKIARGRIKTRWRVQRGGWQLAIEAWSSELDGLPLPLSAIEVDWLPVPGARLLADIWVHAP